MPKSSGTAWMSPWVLLCGMRCSGQALQPGQAPSSAFSPPSIAQQPAKLPQVGTVQTTCAASYSAALRLQNRPHVLSPGPKSFPESFTKRPQKPSRRHLEQLLAASCTPDVELSHLPDQVMAEGTSDRGAAQPGRDKPLSLPGNETPSESPRLHVATRGASQTSRTERKNSSLSQRDRAPLCGPGAVLGAAHNWTNEAGSSPLDTQKLMTEPRGRAVQEQSQVETARKGKKDSYGYLKMGNVFT